MRFHLTVAVIVCSICSGSADIADTPLGTPEWPATTTPIPEGATTVNVTAQESTTSLEQTTAAPEQTTAAIEQTTSGESTTIDVIIDASTGAVNVTADPIDDGSGDGMTTAEVPKEVTVPADEKTTPKPVKPVTQSSPNSGKEPAKDRDCQCYFAVYKKDVIQHYVNVKTIFPKFKTGTNWRYDSEHICEFACKARTRKLMRLDSTYGGETTLGNTLCNELSSDVTDAAELAVISRSGGRSQFVRGYTADSSFCCNQGLFTTCKMSGGSSDVIG